MTTPAFPIVGCCIDRSPSADLVIDEAIRLRLKGVVGTLHLVHVMVPPEQMHAGPFTYRVPDPLMVREAREWLDERAAAVRDAETVVLQGHPTDAVSEWAARAGADLLIVAAHHGAVSRALHGEFAGDLVYAAPCPVLALRPA